MLTSSTVRAYRLCAYALARSAGGSAVASADSVASRTDRCAGMHDMVHGHGPTGRPPAGAGHLRKCTCQRDIRSAVVTHAVSCMGGKRPHRPCHSGQPASRRAIRRPSGATPRRPRAAYCASAKAAQETFAEPQALTRTYQLPIGELPGTAFIELRTSDLLVHAWDLAFATGQQTDLDPELAEYVLAFSKQMMSRPGLRGGGRPFGGEQRCGDERPAADRVAAFLGRELS